MANETGLEGVRERARKATAGPWEVVHDINVMAPDPRGGKLSPLSNSSLSFEQRKDNHIFVANARQDIPMLLDEIDRLKTESLAGREAEMERCCRDVCHGCRHGVPLTESGENHASGTGAIYECNAAPIRERWAGKGEG